MPINWIIVAAAVFTLFGLAACTHNEAEPDLHPRKPTGSPDEFAIVPSEPIEFPDTASSLPVPIPGAPNRVDPNPDEQVIVALGGSPNTRLDAGIPEPDARMLRYVTRAGVDPTIRQSLAAEDLEYRRANDGRLLERWFNVNLYYQAYAPLALDNYAELERLRNSGVKTPAAPPEPR